MKTKTITRKRANSLRQVQFDNAFIFRYSTRQDTPAATMPNQVPEQIKEERNQDLLGVVNESVKQANDRLVGRDVEILCEGPSRTNASRLMGRTRTNKVVVFEGEPDRVGEIFDVHVRTGEWFQLVWHASRARLTRVSPNDLSSFTSDCRHNRGHFAPYSCGAGIVEA